MQFLTYRWGRKYETHNVGTYGPQVKEGDMSLNDEIHRGDYKQTSAGTEWWGESGFGSDNYRDAQADGRYWQQVDTGRKKRAGLLDADQQQWQDFSPLVRHWCGS